MNPIKELGKVIPGLKDVLESIHAHLEHILDEDRRQTQLLEQIRNTLENDKESIVDNSKDSN